MCKKGKRIRKKTSARIDNRVRLCYNETVTFGGKIMNIWLAILLLVVGFVCLVKGADWFVDGAAGIAEKLRVPQLVIGLTVVAFGTSAPELATSIISSVQGDTGIAIGNIVGSNITNILLILGLAAVIAELPVYRDTLRIDMPVLIGASALLLLCGLDGALSRLEGIVFFAISTVYTVLLIWLAIRQRNQDKKRAEILELREEIIIPDDGDAEEPKTAYGRWYKSMKAHTWFLTVVTLVGLAIVVLGAQFAVEGATAIAEKIGISQRIIGLTVVAIGTSLPELVTCVVAATKGNTDIAVGDIVGSCIFNILRTLGIAATIMPLAFASEFLIDAAIALGATVLLSVLGWLKNHKIQRWGGIVMLAGFAAYYVYLFMI